MISLDEQWRECKRRYDGLNKDKNCYQKEVTKAKKAGGEDPENAAKILAVNKEIEQAKGLEGEKCYHERAGSAFCFLCGTDVLEREKTRKCLRRC